jgi:hypothetical protein
LVWFFDRWFCLFLWFIFCIVHIYDAFFGWRSTKVMPSKWNLWSLHFIAQARKIQTKN